MTHYKKILGAALLVLIFAAAGAAQTAPPALTPIGAQSVDEGQILSFTVSATDADLTTPVMRATSPLPAANMTFTDNLDGTASFSFSPDFTQSGSINITFYADDAVTADIDSEQVVITVNNVNQAPVLAAIGPQSVNEGVNLSFTVTATDADGTIPTLTTSALPANATFTDNLDGTGSFSFTPDFTQSGVVNVTFTASDGTDSDAELVAITVNNVNQAPVLAAIGPQSVNEGVNLSFTVTATDADGTIPTLTTSALPANATFTDNLDGTGSFSFTPNFTQSGVINVTFTASDGTDSDAEIVAITVNNVNQAPVLAAIGPQSVNEGVNLSFTVTATDADGTIPTLTTSALPANATFTDNLDGTGSFSFTPDFTQSGVINVTFTASDGTDSDAELVAITVNNVNQAPVLATIGPRNVNEGVNLSFTVTATDADGTIPTLTTSALPANATFTDNLDGTGSFSFTPDFTQSGVVNITFTASDGTDSDAELVAITVNNVNQAPVWNAQADTSIVENQTLVLTVSATDADGQALTLTAQNLPATNATFLDNGDNSGTLTFTPDNTQSGSYPIDFLANDGSGPVTLTVTVSVGNVNLPPVLAAIGPRNVNEGATLAFTVTATDADGTIPTLTTSALPANATFTDNLDGTGSFSFTPNFTQSGVFNITFTASDGTDSDAEIVAITVNNVNQAPVLAAIGPRNVNEGATLAFTVTATDADGTIPTLTTSALPANATFTDNLDGTGSFSFTPNFTQSGVFNITFTASDGTDSDAEIVAITVNNVNQAPVLAAIGPRNVNEGVNLSFTVTATDADGTIPTLTTSALPANATFVDNLDGTGSFSFTPNFTQSGVINVTFTASDGTDSDAELVAITVNNVNQAPVLAAIGPRNVNEGVNLSFTVTATDADGTIPTLTTSALPANATFTDNLDGTGSFSFTPNFTQSGVFNITFTASDGTDSDAELVAITVNNVNQAPVLAAIGPRNVNEGVNLSFTVTATDADGTIPTLTTSALPANATFVDNLDGTGSFSFTPNFTQSGVFNITFTASDGTDSDAEIVAITVNNVNLPPVLATIGSRVTTEGVTLAFTVSASDPDGTTPTLTAAPLPPNATFVDNGNGTANFSFTPDFSQAGVYNITFTATDPSTATDFEVVTITVNDAGNQAPVLAAIGPQSVDEGQLLTFGVSATDADGTIQSLTANNLPANASFVDNGNGTGTFSFTPTFNQQGTYNVTFTATDNLFSVDVELVVITVNQINLAPTLNPIGAQAVTEGNTLNVTVTASDPDGTIPVLTASPLPANATFVDNLNGTGSFSFTPDFTQAGSYNITFAATDDSGVVASELVTVTVNDAGNQPPVLAAIGPRSVDEGVLLTFGVSATDADGTIQSLSATNLPANASFVDNGNGTGTFSFTPDFTQQGIYNVTFTATDNGSATDQEIVAITVNQINLGPVLNPIGAQAVTEGNTLNVTVTATDPDGTIPVLTASPLPANASFTDNLNGTGSFSFTPNFTQAGTYNITFAATDDSGVVASELVTVTVSEGGNQPPVLATIGPRNVNEGATLTFGVSATDVDGTIQSLTATNLPANASFVDNGNGTGTFSFTPNFTQQGTYNVTFTATDNGLATDQEIVAITVNQINLPPVLAAIGPQSGTEAVLLTFTVSATDPDGTIPSLAATPLPANATFVDNLDGTGTFSFTPSFSQAGFYNISFTATDDSSATDAEIVTVTITEAGNQAPILAAIGPQSVNEGQLLTFGVSATDPDGTIQSLTANNLPANASFVDNGNGTGTFSFTPNFTQQGTYNVTFTATDNLFGTDVELVVITVNQINLPPTLTAIGAQSVAEGATLNVTVTASDPDGTIPVLTASPLPANATFVDNLNGTGSFSFTPNFTQAGTYDITFAATDDSGVVASELVTVTVTDGGNQPPVLAAIGPRSVSEGQLLTFGVSATDVDGTIQSLAATNLPANATFVDNGNGTGTFSFTPNFTQQGTYNVTFTATDNGLATDQEIVAITVNQVNLGPTLNPIGPLTVTEGSTLLVTVTSSDPDGTFAVLTASQLPANASFVDNGDGTGDFSFTPGFTQAGLYNITFTATDDSGVVASELVTVTVNDGGNQAPVLAAIGPRNVNEGATLTFGVSATDVDGTIQSLTATNLPVNATFVYNGNGTGTFSFTPTFTQQGTYNVTFTATDNGLATDEEIVVITVNQINLPPVLAAIGPRLATEGALLTFTVSATDPDGTLPSLSAAPLPANATFVDNLDGTGTFNFTPGFSQAGIYNITFTAADDSAATDAEIVTVTVTEAGNQPPVLATIGPRSVNENQLLTFGVSATDPDGTIQSLTATNLPANATFIDNGNGTGTFSFTPSFTQQGTYNVTFTATDNLFGTDVELVVITVNQINLPPTLTAIGAQSVAEGATLNLTVTSSDPDGTPAVMTATPLPANATYVDNGNGTGSFSFTPDFTQAGTYDITFAATDDSGVVASELVTVTVTEAGNQAPVLAAIGDTTIVETQPLALTISAVDPDAEIPTLTAYELGGVVLPANATFTDNGNGTGSFGFTPDLNQSGVYSIVFKAEDAALAVDSQVVTITVNETNQAPVLALISDASVLEGANLTFGISATDADGTTPALLAVNLPLNAALVDNLNGTGTFTFDPDFTQAGSYIVTFIATDGFQADSQDVTLTVTDAGNQPPVLDPIPDTLITEGSNLTIPVVSNDPDGTIPTLTAQNLPANATFTDNGDGTGTFVFDPNFVQSGTYVVQIIADDGTAQDTITVTITVQDVGNLPPVFAVVNDTTINEGTSLVLNVSATDPDGGVGAIPILSISTALSPTQYTFVDNLDGTGVFTYNSNFFSAGIKTVTFLAIDNGTPNATGQLPVTITVADVNRPPALVIGGPYGVVVGDSVSVTIAATDSTDPVSTNRVQLSGVGLPATARFVDNGNNTGTLTYTPLLTDVGVRSFTILAVDRGTPALSVTGTVNINVVVQNIRPILDPIGPQIVTEGQTLNLLITATDPDGGGIQPSLYVNQDKLPPHAAFTDLGTGTAAFSFTPDYTMAGSGPSALYSVTFYATDGIDIDKEVVLFQVNEAGDQDPIFDSIPTATAVEGNPLTATVTAYDPDGGPIALTAVPATLPAGATFTDNGNGSGTLSWTPGFTAAGTYNIDIIAEDQNGRQTTITVPVTIQEAGNQLPVLATIANQQTTELRNLQFTVTATDPDGDVPVLSAVPLPGSATLTPNGTGAATFSWTPTDTDSGTYNIMFYATDALDINLIDSQAITITVVDTNRVPRQILPFIANATINEGQVYVDTIFGADPDGPTPRFTARLSGTDTLATNMSFVDLHDGRGVFTFAPSYTQGNSAVNFLTYNVDFLIIDSILPTLFTVVPSIQYRVNNTNQPPDLIFPNGAGPFTMDEGDTLSVLVAAIDGDGGSVLPNITTGPLPTNSTYSVLAPNSGRFRFVPSFTQAGVYTVLFRATDAALGIDTQSIVITVVEAGNQAPRFTTTLAPSLNMPADNLTQITVTATDPDLNVLTIVASPVDPALPGANFLQTGNSGTWSYQPALSQAGNSYNLTFIVSDPGGLADTLQTTLVVVTFLRGDVDDNNYYGINDLAVLVDYLFRQGPSPKLMESADVDGNGRVNLGDVSYLVTFMYRDGPMPPQ